MLIYENLCENILFYNVAYKTLYGTKLLRVIFDKVDEYIRKCDCMTYLALFHSNEKYKKIFDRIRYLIILEKCLYKWYKNALL